jgi:hypothetical protein
VALGLGERRGREDSGEGQREREENCREFTSHENVVAGGRLG